MPINATIPKSSHLCIVGCEFKSVLSNPTIGKYDFTNYLVGGNRINAVAPIGLKMNPSFLYYFHQMNFSLSIDEGAFLRAIDAGTVPTLEVRDSSNRKSTLYHSLRLFRYYENSALDSYHYNANTNAEFITDFQCVLDQVADLVGVTEIYAQISFSIYEITDNAFIESYKRGE